MANSYPTRPARLDFGGKGYNSPSIDPLYKGSTFQRRIQVENLDLTGLEIRMSVKENYGDAPEIFFSTENNPATEAYIAIDPDGATWFELRMSADLTAAVDAGTGDCWPRKKKYRYDLELVDGSSVYMFLQGEFWVVDELTTES
jgi:hypothetical protein